MLRGSVTSHERRVPGRHAVRTFSFVLAAIISVRTASAVLRKGSKKGSTSVLRVISLDSSAVKIALFPTLIPELYALLKARLKERKELAELFTSPLLLLLPPSWRIQVALYAASAALLNTGKESIWRKLLPPTWTLNVLGNVWLLWAFIFKSKAFPKSYEKVILSHSTQYVPQDMSKKDLEVIFANTKFERWTDEPPSKRLRHYSEICAKLHPSEPSCFRNYLNAWIYEFMGVSKWVGGFSALPIILLKQRRMSLKRSPKNVISVWLSSTLRGTAFVVGSINTSWALTCLLQRIIPSGRMTRSRWILNGSIGSLWILALQPQRRAEFALYVARLASLSAWNAWRLEGGIAIPYGEVILFALSWMKLARIREGGEKISGLVGLGMDKLSL